MGLSNHLELRQCFCVQLADIAIDSLCRGVFAGDCRKLSVRSCLPPLYNAEKARGSIVLGMVLGSGKKIVLQTNQSQLVHKRFLTHDTHLTFLLQA